MKAVMLIDGVKSTYVFETALENLEKWFGDGRYSDNGMSPPIWVETSEDGNSALIIYNGGINNGKYPTKEFYDADFFTESYSDSRINSIFSACMDPTNKVMMSETEGVYFINENSSAQDIKDFANKVKNFASRTIMSPASIVAMESHTEDLTMFKILASAAAESENVALQAALESARKHNEAMNGLGLEEYNDFDRKGLEEQIDILNMKPSEHIDPDTFEEPSDLGNTNNIPTEGDDEVRIEDLDEDDLGHEVPLINDDSTVEDDLKPSDTFLSDSKPLDDKETIKPVETPKNSLLDALNALKEKMGITDEEFISRLEKVMLIGKLAGGVQSAAVEEEKAPITENSFPEAEKQGRGGDGLYYIDTPEGVVTNMPQSEDTDNENLENINADDLFGDDYGDDNDEEGRSEADSESGNDDIVDNGTTEEGSGSDEDVQAEPKEINEDLPPDELIKELANESKTDDEFFEMLIKRRVKFGLPTLIKASNIDMRNYILTGVESAVPAEVKSKRISLI